MAFESSDFEEVKSCSRRESGPKLMTNARSLGPITLSMNAFAERFSSSIRFSWLTLTSKMIPSVRGKLDSEAKYLISWGTPSSFRAKSSFVRLLMKRPCLSRTEAKTFTTSTSMEMIAPESVITAPGPSGGGGVFPPAASTGFGFSGLN